MGKNKRISGFLNSEILKITGRAFVESGLSTIEAACLIAKDRGHAISITTRPRARWYLLAVLTRGPNGKLDFRAFEALRLPTTP